MIKNEFSTQLKKQKLRNSQCSCAIESVVQKCNPLYIGIALLHWIHDSGGVHYYFFESQRINFKSAGISIGVSGGTFDPPVFPTGISPMNDFNPPIRSLGI